MELKETLNLPNPDFTIPMKAGLPNLEPQIQIRWKEMDLYRRIRETRKGNPRFVFHDGPPYTNSPIHLGTALNKTLKDFAVKTRSMLGYDATYVPGFDNHGLPIEQAVMKKFADKKITPTREEVLAACRAHAEEFIQLQSEQFQRLGVFALWEKPYKTMDFRYEAGEVRVFKKLVEAGAVYRGLRPVQWSPTLQSALADTEIVYHEGHVSKSIMVRFPLKADPNRMFEKFPNLYGVIWTTTPWTIPANLAIAFHPEFVYAIVRVGDDHYVVLEDLLARVAEKAGWTNYEVVGRFDGINFEKAVFAHPIYGRDSIAVMADYVTTEDGTGLVHTAPGHGRDDFMTGAKYGLPVLCPVDGRGILTEEAGEFAGIHYKKCDEVVVDRLREVGHLLDVRDYVHSYPYAERDDQPVIFRATDQWFISIDGDDLRQRMLEEIEKVEWLPASGKSRITAMIANRPDWCVSRQRPWGVGIPIFYGKKGGKPVMDPVAIEAVAVAIEKEGAIAWHERTPEEILPAGYTDPETGETEFTKGADILDVWFDSGSSALLVLVNPLYPEWDQDCYPADLYLEGSDQHRGWFNTSLILGTALMGEAPYRKVLTHGFVVDSEGRKMSKRWGNVIDPIKVCDTMGADILRFWVASVDWQGEAPCTDELLKKLGDEYRTVRNTLRFLLANLYDYSAPAEITEPFDQWIVQRVDLLAADVADGWLRYDFGYALAAIHDFCAKELSKTYLDALKDRMYCDGADWQSRRSGQAACHYALLTLLRLIAPTLPHTAEEVYARVPAYEKLESVHLEVLNVPTKERLEEIENSPLQQLYSHALNERADAFAAFETWKTGSDLKDSQDIVVTVTNSADQIAALQAMDAYELANLWKFAWVEIKEGAEAFDFRPSDHQKCERSRLRRPDVAEAQGHWLTERDRRALGWA